MKRICAILMAFLLTGCGGGGGGWFVFPQAARPDAGSGDKCAGRS